MSNTFKFGAGNWAYKDGKVLAYNDENNNFKPLPFDFTRASSATRVNKQGLIEVVGIDEPRVDYLNNADGHLLLEPSRSNIMLYSEEFDNAYWTKNNVTVLADNAISPDGSQNADKLTFLTSSGEIVRTTTFTSGVQYTMSFYAKTESGTLTFDYGNIDYVSVSGTATTEWQRFVITQTAPATTRFPKIQTTETGSLLLWGFQVEQGSYATSYIPTSGSSVTRAADSTVQTAPTSVIGQTEGTFYTEFSRLGLGSANSALVSVTDGTSNNRLRIISTSYFALRFIFQLNGNAIQYDISTTSLFVDSYTQLLKVAVAYKSGDIAVYINGELFNASSNTLTFSASLNTYQLENGTTSNIVRDAKLYNTRLSNAELAALTS